MKPAKMCIFVYIFKQNAEIGMRNAEEMNVEVGMRNAEKIYHRIGDRLRDLGLSCEFGRF